MIVLETIQHETIWGGSRLAKIAGLDKAKIGHLYSVYCRDGISNTILNGKWKGKRLYDSFSKWKKKFDMENYEHFPLTIALTEANENLSIQVHPNDDMANKTEHMSKGKRESWYFLQEPYSGSIINGCICKTEEQKEEMLKEKKYLEMAKSLSVCVGDYVFVEPGTLHSLTAGSLVYEIEEGADYTYRFYDYDRLDTDGKPRELHIDKACEALDIHAKSVVKHYSGENEIIEKTYITKRIVDKSEYINNSKTVECFTLIEGALLCDGVKLCSGMTVLLWPDEKIENADIKLAFVAKMRGDVH